MFGHAFRELRKDKGFSIKELTVAGPSESSIRRFETEQQDMGVENLSAILRVMNVSMGEWLLTLNEEKGLLDTEQSKLMQFYFGNDAENIAKEYNSLAQRFKLDANFELLKQIAGAASLYTDLTNKVIISKSLLSKVVDVLFNTSYWGIAEIEFFGDSVALLTAPQLLLILKDIISQIHLIEKRDSRTYMDCWNAILNGYLIVIQKNLDFAQELQPLIMRLETPVQVTSIQIRRYFINEVLNYQLATTDLEKMKFSSNIIRVISLLDDVGNKQMANQYMVLFTQIKGDK